MLSLSSVFNLMISFIKLSVAFRCLAADDLFEESTLSENVFTNLSICIRF